MFIILVGVMLGPTQYNVLAYGINESSRIVVLPNKLYERPGLFPSNCLVPVSTMRERERERERERS
jgi:hypothetical protein